MKNHSQITNQGIESINDDDLFDGMSNESRELFMSVLADVVNSEALEIEEKIKNIELPPPSKRHKIRMNRLFRERVGGTFLPFPEADNFYERVRSKLVIKLKINEFFDRREKRRREIKG